MKFEEAFELAFNRLDTVEREKGLSLGVTPRTAKSLVFFWNMMKEAKGKFDDFVMIDKNNNVISIDHIDPIKQAGTDVSVDTLLDVWSKDKEIEKEITTIQVGELLSSANVEIVRGVYFHEFMTWLEKKKITVLEDKEVVIEDPQAIEKLEKALIPEKDGESLDLAFNFLDSLELDSQLSENEITFEDAEQLLAKIEENLKDNKEQPTGISLEGFIKWIQNKDIEVIVDEEDE